MVFNWSNDSFFSPIDFSWDFNFFEFVWFNECLESSGTAVLSSGVVQCGLEFFFSHEGEFVKFHGPRLRFILVVGDDFVEVDKESVIFGHVVGISEAFVDL